MDDKDAQARAFGKAYGLYASFHAGVLRTVCSDVMLLYAKELAGAFLAFMEGKWRVNGG